MNPAANAFIKYLDRKDIKYSTHEPNIVYVNYSTETISHIKNVFVFSDDTHDVRIAAYGFIKFPEDKIGIANLACCAINPECRWGKFYIDSDRDVMVEIDAIITPSTVGEVCFELMYKLMNNAERAYSTFVRALWDDNLLSGIL